MIPSELRGALGGELGGAFYLHGSEEHGKEAAAASLIAAHLDPATRDFNYDLIRGSELDVETLASVLGTPPMMAEWRVVLVRETQGLVTSPRARSLLLDVVKSPPPGLALILLCTKPAGSSARFYTELEKAARALEFHAPDPNDLPGWIMDWSRETFDCEIAEDAARALAQAVGPNVAILARELEKLSTRVAPGEAITREVVESLGGRIPRQDRWEWFDLVGEARFEEALRGLPILLQHGESGVGLTIGLGTHLLRLGVAVEGGAGALEGALPPRQRWLARRFAGQARRWSSEEVRAALDGLLEVDRLLKASGISDSLLLEGWLLERMVRRAAAA